MPLAEQIGLGGAREHAGLVDPAAEIGRDRHVGRRGHDAAREFAARAADLVHDLAEALLGGDCGRSAQAHRRHRQRRVAFTERRAFGGDRHSGQEAAKPLRCDVEAGGRAPFRAVGNPLHRFESRHLRRIHQSGMIVLVPGQGQVPALDGIGDETMRGFVRRSGVEGLDQRFHVMTGEIGHELVERFVVMRLEQARDSRDMAEIGLQPRAPSRSTLVGQRGVKIVRAIIDPAAQLFPARPGEGRLEPLAVFEHHHFPAHGSEELLDLLEQAVIDHAVETLAIVVDHPPKIAHVLLGAFKQRLEHVAFVELGVAHYRDHAAGRPVVRRQVLQPHIVLHQGCEQGHADAEADRAGGEIHLGLVLGARGIGLRAAEAAEILERRAALPPEQVLDGVEDRRRVRLDRDAVGGPERVEVKRGQQRHRRGATRLMPAHLQPVAVLAQVVGVMDHPGREPQHLAFQRAQHVEARRVRRRGWGLLSLRQDHGRGITRNSAAHHCEDAKDMLIFRAIIAMESVF